MKYTCICVLTLTKQIVNLLLLHSHCSIILTHLITQTAYFSCLLLIHMHLLLTYTYKHHQICHTHVTKMIEPNYETYKQAETIKTAIKKQLSSLNIYI